MRRCQPEFAEKCENLCGLSEAGKLQRCKLLGVCRCHRPLLTCAIRVRPSLLTEPLTAPLATLQLAESFMCSPVVARRVVLCVCSQNCACCVRSSPTHTRPPSPRAYVLKNNPSSIIWKNRIEIIFDSTPSKSKSPPAPKLRTPTKEDRLTDSALTEKFATLQSYLSRKPLKVISDLDNACVYACHCRQRCLLIPVVKISNCPSII